MSQSPSFLDYSPTIGELKKNKDEQSQSPSFLDYSPTNQVLEAEYQIIVAVPIIFGLLSYYQSYLEESSKKSRSPHHFWTTLLHFSSADPNAGESSQSPSFLDYSPTRRAWGRRKRPASQSPSFLDYSPTLEFRKKLKTNQLSLNKTLRIVILHVI